MFSGKNTLIFAKDGRYLVDLGKIWELWQNIEKAGGTYCCWLVVLNKGKKIVAYKKKLVNYYVNEPHVRYTLLCLWQG
jgi:ABC-type transport system substrate-binding protein